MRCFVNDAGGWVSLSRDADVFAVIPDGCRDVEEAEFHQVAGMITIEPPQLSRVAAVRAGHPCQ